MSEPKLWKDLDHCEAIGATCKEFRQLRKIIEGHEAQMKHLGDSVRDLTTERLDLEEKLMRHKAAMRAAMREALLAHGEPCLLNDICCVMANSLRLSLKAMEKPRGMVRVEANPEGEGEGGHNR